MNYWAWIAVAWVLLGIATVLTISIAEKSSGGKGPLCLSRPLISLGYSAALFAGAPFILVFALAVCGTVLWKGKLPVSDKVWWPARAKQIDRRHGYSPSRETTLCRMIELRRRKDPRLKDKTAPSDWPMFQLWQSTESEILTTIEQYLTLKHDGLSNLDALQKIGMLEGSFDERRTPDDPSVSNYLTYRLRIGDPQYLALGPDVFDKVMSIARRFALKKIRHSETQKPFPPSEWLLKEMTDSEVENFDVRSQPDPGDWKFQK